MPIPHTSFSSSGSFPLWWLEMTVDNDHYIHYIIRESHYLESLSLYFSSNSSSTIKFYKSSTIIYPHITVCTRETPLLEKPWPIVQ